MWFLSTAVQRLARPNTDSTLEILSPHQITNSWLFQSNGSGTTKEISPPDSDTQRPDLGTDKKSSIRKEEKEVLTLKRTIELKPVGSTIIRQTEGASNSFLWDRTAQEIARFHVKCRKIGDKWTDLFQWLLRATSKWRRWSPVLGFCEYQRP